MASRWSDIFEREPEREPELGPSNEPGPQPDSWFADKVEDVPPMQATQAPQPEAEFQDGIEVEEEDEPAPKRKKVMSRAARAWRRWVCGGRERTREWRCAFASLLAECACAREAVIRSVRYSLFSVSMLLSSYES